MADQALTTTKLKPNVASAAITATAMTVANDGLITPTKDGRMIIIVTDTGGAGGTATIKAGTGALGYEVGDLVVTLGASETMAVVIESARFKALSGTDKGKIRIDASVNISLMAFEISY